MTTSFNLLGSTTLGSGATSITVNITSKKYLIVEISTVGNAANVYGGIQFNSDTATNYAQRIDGSNSGDTVTSSTSSIRMGDSSGTANAQYYYATIVNISSQEKLLIGWAVDNTGGSGSGNVPYRIESVGKWANTSNGITSITLTSIGGGNFGTGSIMTVYGSD